MSTKNNPLQTPDSWEAMQEVVDRARAGDESAMPALKAILDRLPIIREDLGGDLERTVEFVMCRTLGGTKDLAFREAVRRKLASLREELAGPQPCPAERLLVDRVVACWLQVQEADWRYVTASDCSTAQANYHLKRQDRAHRRFLSAMKTLATVRKMALPTLQVNIAENQVNVANATVASEAT